MRQSVQFDLKAEATNRSIGEHPFARARRVRAQRAATRAALDPHLLVPPLVVDGHDNVIVVTLVRISAGAVDDDALVASFKHVRDEVAEWVGIDDRDERIRFQYRQQQCPPSFGGTRVRIEDLSTGSDTEVVVGRAPERLGPELERATWGRPAAQARKAATPAGMPPAPRKDRQRELVYRRCWAIVPWDQTDPDDPVVRELPKLSTQVDPPELVRMRVPRQVLAAVSREHGRALQHAGPGLGYDVLLRRHNYRDEGLGGDVWLYFVDEPDALAGQAGRGDDDEEGRRT